MARPRSAHRRSFARTTALAIGVLVVVLAAAATLLGLIGWTTIGDGLAAWVSWPLVAAVTAVLIVLGGLFALIGSVGMVKLPDLLTRLHAPTKATTLGVEGLAYAQA